MFFTSGASLSALISWCRTFRHSLHAGLPIVKVFQSQINKGPKELRPVAERITAMLQQGEALEDALDAEKDRFPPLFRELVSIGERTGHLPEMFAELEQYYTMQQSLRRQFIQQISWPVFQFFAGVLVIALLIWILGMIADTRGGPAIAPIGFGLTGASGAITFLVAVGLFLVSLLIGYKMITSSFRRRTVVEAFLLRIPAVGPCVQAFALGRFSLGLRLTLETAMKTDLALRQSLRATANAAFLAYEDIIAESIKKGSEIHEALRPCPVFPTEFVEVVEVGEVSGQLPEVMEKQARFYEEEASRRLKTLTRSGALAVYLLIAIFLIWAIFSIASIYLNAISGI